MTKCGYKNNDCKAADCSKNPKDCALKTFLDFIKKEERQHPEEKKKIENLKRKYVDAWNKHPNQGKGPALGKAFEKWIIDDIEETDLLCSPQKKVNFDDVFKFKVDCAIFSAQNPKVILEIKINSDIQHVLAMRGLLDYLQDGKLGYVALYNPLYNPQQGRKRKKEGGKGSGVMNILKDIKRNYESRFDYFIIQGGWSKSLERLKAFCSK